MPIVFGDQEAEYKSLDSDGRPGGLTVLYDSIPARAAVAEKYKKGCGTWSEYSEHD